MNNKKVVFAIPLALLLTACVTIDPAFKDIAPASGSCIDGGPDAVAQKFYNLRIQQKDNKVSLPNDAAMAQLHPYLSQALYHDLQAARQQASKPGNRLNSIKRDIFTSQPEGITQAEVASASTIPNADAKNIPLRVQLVYQPANELQRTLPPYRWQDEILMIRERSCWVIDDIRFMGTPAAASTLRQLLFEH